MLTYPVGLFLAAAVAPCFTARVRRSAKKKAANTSGLAEYFDLGDSPESSAYNGGCDEEGIVCKDLDFSGFTYQCRYAGQADKGNVILLHGFPMWSEHYNGLMLELASHGYGSVACNQRGYSPGASPAEESQYNYDLLRDDVFALADKVGFEKFHLVGHDHGAVLGWYTAGSSQGASRILSYTSMSIPHTSAFNKALYGPDADVAQQVASQYFTMFVLPDSASIRAGALWNSLGRYGGFKSAEDFQKALWWYNGAYEVGVMAMPPLMSTWQIITASGDGAMASLRTLYGGEPDDGRPAKVASGDLTMPTLYICGKDDAAILCNTPVALTTKDYCKGGYTYLETNCGHEPLNCGFLKGKATQQSIDAIVNHIKASS